MDEEEHRAYLVIDTERWGSRGARGYTPPELAAGPVALQRPDQIAAVARQLWDAGKKPVLLILAPTKAGDAIVDERVVSRLASAAILRAAPLLPDGGGGFTYRDPTPVDHTLFGVLTRIQLDDPDPSLRWKVDRVYADRYRWVRHKCAEQLRGFPDAAIDELVQDVLVESWRHMLGSYRPDASFKAFLAGIALNKARAARRRRRDELLGDDELLEAFAASSPDGGRARSVLEGLEAEERDQLVVDAVESALGPVDQEVAVLRYRDDLPFEQIAELTGLAGRAAVHAAMMRIRRRLAPELARRLAALSLPAAEATAGRAR